MDSPAYRRPHRDAVEESVALVVVRLDPLGPEQGGQEVGVHGESDQLGVDQRDRHPVIAQDEGELLSNPHQFPHHGGYTLLRYPLLLQSLLENVRCPVERKKPFVGRDL